MARISRVRGPAADVVIGSTLAVVTGLEITRTFGNGVLWISATVSIVNGTGLNVTFEANLFVDGVAVFGDNVTRRMIANEQDSIVLSALEAVVPGVHTVDVRVQGAAGAGDLVRADACEFFLVELPDWDDDAFLVTL